MSEFSIDYILNRAGDRYLGTNNSVGLLKRIKINNSHNFHPYFLNENQDLILNDQSKKLEFLQQLHQQQQHQQSLEQLQPMMFDWLQYSRIHPPKLPRSLRQMPSKRTPGRLPRIPFTPAQLQALENAYKNSNYLSAEDANKLAESLDLTNTRVKIWFQNRRARERREKREREESYDSNTSSNSSSPEPEDIIDIE